VAGKLIERSVRLGDNVRKGQMVARLDPVDAEKQLAAAQAALAAAEHRLTFAKQQLDRDAAVRAQKLIAAAQLEQTQDAYSAALANRDQAADQLVLARNTLEYHTLRADHDGIITTESADTGQVVAMGQPIFGLAWSGDIDIVMDVPASDITNVAAGQTASVTFPVLPGREFEARVREVAPSADPQSRTYRVKLTLSEPGPSVRLGMTGDAVLTPKSVGAAEYGARTFSVPATALFHRGKGPAVWVVRAADSTLELRPVNVLTYTERSVAISGGLKEGDIVLRAGVHTVYEGERVKAVKPLFYNEHDETGSQASARRAPETEVTS